MTRVAILAGLAASLWGCPAKEKGSDRGVPLLEEIEVFDRSRADERVAGVTAALVRDWVLGRLRSAKQVRLVKKSGPKVYRLRLEFGVGVRDEERVVLVSARGSVPELDGVALQASASKDLDQPSASQVKKVVDLVVTDVLFQARLVGGSQMQLTKILKSEKDEQRLAAAVEITAVRRPPSAVAPLIKLLKHKNDQIADRAIGALVAIGDRKAVRPLTRLTKFGNTEKMAKILDGIGALGGKEAKEYLEFVSTGHDDADIRNLAAEALERMKRREKRTTK